MSSVFQYKVNDTSKNKYNLQEALSYSPKWRLQAISTDGVESILKPLPHCRYIRLLSDSLMRLISVKWRWLRKSFISCTSYAWWQASYSTWKKIGRKFRPIFLRSRPVQRIRL